MSGIKQIETWRKKRMSTVACRQGCSAQSSEPLTRLVHKQESSQCCASNPPTMGPPPIGSNTRCMKILSWNVNGLATVVSSGFSLLELAVRENCDVLCLQETHLKKGEVVSFKNVVDGFDYSYWSCSVKHLGTSGTVVISRVEPTSFTYGIGIREHDLEGRVITLEFDGFYLVNAYFPFRGTLLDRLSYRVDKWDPCFSNYIKKLECSKPVILCGDLNCTLQPIDIHDPRKADFDYGEMDSFKINFSSKGLIDTFRKQHPNAVEYTFWGGGDRITNKGRRLDYFIASECIADKVHDSYILQDVWSSDHSPIGLVLKL